jgi:drug/metabolite transporter (DMT)-like permease
VLGASVVLTRGAPWTLVTGGVGVGEWLLLGCVLCWSGYTLVGKRLLGGIDALTTTTVTAGVGLLLLLLVALAVEGGSAFAAVRDASLGVWLALVFLAAGATVLAYAWYFEGVKALGAGAAAAYISLVPVFGVLFATWGLGEAVDASLVLGGGLVLTGMVVMNRARR